MTKVVGQKSSELPVLRVVHVADMELHEYTDPDRCEPLARRLLDEGRLMNPPIVAPIPHSHKYVVLDGANRTTALARAGCRDAVVQVIDYNDPDLNLEVWHHLVIAPSAQAVLDPMHQVPGLRLRSVHLSFARVLLANRGILAFVNSGDNRVLVAEGGLNKEDEIKLLNGLVQSYHGRFHYYRVKSDELNGLVPLYDNAAALVAFPTFEPDDIIYFTKNGVKLPAGITRHVIPKRALRINIPLVELQSERSLEEKNVWLSNEIKRRLLNRQIRSYQEPTVLFDE